MFGFKGKFLMNPIKTLVIVEDEPLIAMDIWQRCEDAGYTVEAIRKRCPDIKVVFVTGTTDPVKLERIAATKPATVLSKPLQSRRLEEALQAPG